MVMTCIRIGLYLVTALAFAWGIYVYAVLSAPVEAEYTPNYVVSLNPDLDVSAASWIVFDVERGMVLYDHSADTPRSIASVTKLATAARFLEANDLSETTTITADDVATYGYAGKLKDGEDYTLRELLFPLILESSNDAAEALARVDNALLPRMNAYRDELALQHTSFDDPSGLSKDNVSTARELMQLSRHIFEYSPFVFDMSRLREYYAPHNGWVNNNPFFNDKAYRGGKHGFTNAAKLTAVAYFDEPISGTTRTLGYVLLGSDDLRDDMEALRSFVRHHTSYR